ncbi:MAG: hypothetical protein COV59_01345 [Candidatus Magasanikbacteria bacterium CG11_big_fil_rev_8_21_14_0_20_39_34]|uniref:DHH family phosphoesterase n=1 Tax=Candidatus Magasanikbacteria bacterium CG11_big_fil_rev_8_21_14_0_20_39_34 TaxID=1974653 RepID=A0A2H0N8C6_9BACT|nr:MAG: hypothetical protein COV59_01345 [Candidatus Magasanikbacteria bacterium CG11_big_fil_rev_8_21_14_0_20_39_34]
MVENQALYKKIKNILDDAQNVLLLPHQNPDPDALGSALAMYEFLKKSGKNVKVFCKTGVPSRLHFLPNHTEVVSDPCIWKETPFDTIILFDSGDLFYAGVAEYIEELTSRPTIINIDHHASNKKFGDVNLLDISASSTAEVVYYFFHVNRFEINANMATNLIAGVIADTDNFTNAATNYFSLFVTGDLIKHGGKYKLVKEHLYRDKSVDILKLWGEILGRLQHHTTFDIVYTYISQDDMNRYDVTHEEISGFSNFMNNIQQGCATVFFKEKEDGSIRASLRTTLDHIDVSAIAKHFGGGGHKKACGFEIEGPIETAFERFFQELERQQIPWKSPVGE